MKPHKWAKEIKAWADGAEIEGKWQWAQKDSHASEWCVLESPDWDTEAWIYRIKPQPEKSKYGEVITGRLISNTWLEEHEARINTLERLIKPQPKEPQYLYVYEDKNGFPVLGTNKYSGCIGKIKLETDDE